MNHFFDWIAFSIIIALGYLGYKRGFLEELARLIGLFLSSLAAIKYYSPFSLWLYNHTPLDFSLLSIFSFFIIFFVFLFTIRLLTNTLQIFMLSKGIQWTNKSLGFAFGALKGLFAILIVLWIMDIVPNLKTFDHLKTQSKMYQNLSGYRHWITKMFNIENPVIQGETWIKEKFSNETFDEGNNADHSTTREEITD